MSSRCDSLEFELLDVWQKWWREQVSSFDTKLRLFFRYLYSTAVKTPKRRLFPQIKWVFSNRCFPFLWQGAISVRGMWLFYAGKQMFRIFTSEVVFALPQLMNQTCEFSPRAASALPPFVRFIRRQRSSKIPDVKCLLSRATVIQDQLNGRRRQALMSRTYLFLSHIRGFFCSSELKLAP